MRPRQPQSLRSRSLPRSRQLARRTESDAVPTLAAPGRALLCHASAAIADVEQEIQNTMRELATAKLSGDATEVGRLARREEALRQEKLLLMGRGRQPNEKVLKEIGANSRPWPSRALSLLISCRDKVPRLESTGAPRAVPTDMEALAMRLDQLERDTAATPRTAFSLTTVATSYRVAVSNGTIRLAQQPAWFRLATPPPELAGLSALPPAMLEADVQQQFEETTALALAAAARRPTLRLVGRSSAPSFAFRKPDIVGLEAAPAAPEQTTAVDPVSCSVTHICCLGDLKPRRAAGSEGRFSDEEKGHLLSFVEDLVRQQPWRGPAARVVAFLCDGAHILFFECEFQTEIRGNGHFTVELHRARESAPMPLAGAGGAWLAGLTVAPLAELGYCLPSNLRLASGAAVEVHEYLGMGATADGFAASCSGQAVVLKRYHPNTPAAARAEEAAALAAARGVPGVCQLVGAAGTDVVLAPVGAVSYSLRAPAMPLVAMPQSGLWTATRGAADEPWVAAARRWHRSAAAVVRLPTAADYCDLVDALVGLHEAGWVHRDPRPSNFFRTADGRFFLADLGSAARSGQLDAAERPWAFPYGPLGALRALVTRAPLPPPRPADDMEQVARLVYATLTRYDVLEVDAAAAMLAFWEALEARGLQPLESLLAASAEAAKGDAAGRAMFKAAIRRALA